MFHVISSYKFTITFFVVHISELELSLIYVRKSSMRSRLISMYIPTLKTETGRKRSERREKNNETFSEFFFKSHDSFSVVFEYVML